MPRGFINNYPRSFAFRLTKADGERVDAIAAAQGTTPGEWARAVVSRAAEITYEKRSMRRRVANAELLRRLLAELGRQGNNLNQVAAKLNTDKGLGAQEVAKDLAAIRSGQTTIVAAILAALGGTAQP